MPNNTEKGDLGEQIAISHLLKHGYEIFDKNWRFKHLEIDIVAGINGVLVIVEVKLRASNVFGAPEEFVTKSKQKKLIKAAHHYIIENNIQTETRFDIISIIQNANELVVEHIPSAFYPGL